MDRLPVSSSNLRSVGYDNSSGALEVEFHSGGVYRYWNVPAFHFSRLISASSKGRYLNEYIKRYRYTRIR